jgi:hypothetical protein
MASTMVTPPASADDGPVNHVSLCSAPTRLAHVNVHVNQSCQSINQSITAPGNLTSLADVIQSTWARTRGRALGPLLQRLNVESRALDVRDEWNAVVNGHTTCPELINQSINKRTCIRV